MFRNGTVNERPYKGARLDAGTRRWAVVRLLLGHAQMGGAIVSAVLLFQTGINPVSLGAVIGTCALTTVSVILFGSYRKQPKKEEHPNASRTAHTDGTDC